MKTQQAKLWKLLGCWVFIAIAPAAFSEEKEEDIALENVPSVVITAAKSEVPGIELTEAEIEKEDGTTVYELEGTKGDYEYELEITADGKLLELKKEKKE